MRIAAINRLLSTWKSYGFGIPSRFPTDFDELRRRFISHRITIQQKTPRRFTQGLGVSFTSCQPTQIMPIPSPAFAAGK